ncbi:MAG: dienelactone hydrolase family protein [Kofleriaceae bacterium]
MKTSALLLTVALLGACKDAPPPAAPVATPPAAARIETEALTYAAGELTMQGYMATPTSPGPHPGILVVHEWWGQNDYARRRARELAELGYVALAVDMFGDGQTATTPDEAKALTAAVYADPQAPTTRLAAARAALAADPRVDPARLAAVGYCFGGGVALAAARAGLELDAVLSFHGTLSTKTPMAPGVFGGRVFVATGDADPMVPAADVRALRAELDAAGVPVEIEVYPGATHAFTNPDATATGERFGLPVRYDAAADAASWQAMRAFLAATWPAA